MAHLFRLFADSNDIRDDRIIIKEKGLIFRISRVLRLQPGESVSILDNKGNEYLCSVNSISNSEVSLYILKKDYYKEKLKVNVYASLIKKNRFEFMVEKLSEIGISKITPVIAKNCKIRSINLERLRKIAKESAEQSGKYFVPEVCGIKSLDSIVKEVKNELNLVLYRNAKDALPFIKIKDKEDKINLFIGPEADFTNEEIKAFIKNKFNLVTLGCQLFKTETAGIIGVYLIRSLFQ